MPRLGPIKRRDFIDCFRRLGFEGPFTGSDHQFMVKGDTTIKVPNPHGSGEISGELVRRILRNAGIDRATWERL